MNTFSDNKSDQEEHKKEKIESALLDVKPAETPEVKQEEKTNKKELNMNAQAFIPKTRQTSNNAIPTIDKGDLFSSVPMNGIDFKNYEYYYDPSIQTAKEPFYALTNQNNKTNIHIKFVNNISVSREPEKEEDLMNPSYPNEYGGFSRTANNLEVFILNNFHKTISTEDNLNKLSSFVENNPEFLNTSLFPMVRE